MNKPDIKESNTVLEVWHIITRRHMIEAAMTEPLMQGRWIGTMASSKCPVCMVGGALRQGGVISGQISMVASDQTSINGRISRWTPDFDEFDGDTTYESVMNSLLDKGHWLNALSFFFESMRLEDINDIDDDEPWSKPNMAERLEIVEWIKTNIPEHIKIEVTT